MKNAKDEGKLVDILSRYIELEAIFRGNSL